MDFHFYAPPDSTQKSFRPTRVLFTFLPLFIIAALLPIFLGLIQNPVKTRSSANADQNDLAVWIEPANVIATAGTPVTFTVKALYDGSGKLLPGIIVPVRVDGLASIQDASVEYKTPFTGQVTLGTVVVTPQKSGTYSVYINTTDIVSPHTENKPTSTVSSATLTVR